MTVGQLVRRAGLAAALSLMTIAPAASAPIGAPPSLVETIGADHALSGRVFDTRTGAELSHDEIAERLKASRFVLLGETHANRDHHALQAWAIASAARGPGAPPTVVFEMIPRDYADRLHTHWRAPNTDIDRLGDALDWEERGWPSWEIYRPIFEVVRREALVPRAGDLARATRRRLGRDGTIAALGFDTAAAWGLTVPLPDAERAEMLDILYESHCQLVPRARMASFLDVQRGRDASLADAMIESGSERAVLIAGRGHVRGDHGAPWYLRARQAGGAVLVVAFMEVGQAQAADPAAYVSGWKTPDAIYDIVWFTPRGADVDPCARMRRDLKRRAADGVN